MKRFLVIFAVLLLFTGTAFAACEGDHAFGSWVIKRAATCSQEGHEFRYCRNCDHWEQRYTKKLPHTVEEWNIVKEPTCTEDGVRNATCTVCGAFLRVTIDKLGHDWTVQTARIEPTCKAAGEGDLVCSRCGKVKAGKIPRLEHEWTEYTILEEPRNGKKGLRERTCVLCGEVKKEHYYDEGTLYEEMPANEEVIRMQVMLRDLGYYEGKISSGTFGSLTTKAVSRFQKNNHISASGVADPGTLEVLRSVWEAKTQQSADEIDLNVKE